MSLFLRYLLVAGPSLLLLVLVVALAIRARRRRRRYRAAQLARRETTSRADDRTDDAPAGPHDDAAAIDRDPSRGPS